MPRPPNTDQRILAKLDSLISIEQTTGCWIWMLTLNYELYGQVTRHKKCLRAHRLLYELLIGPIPEGLTLDHRCRHPWCVNPAHMEPVTQKENVRRSNNRAGLNARKTHCDGGHPLDGANLYVFRGHRICRACHANRQRLLRKANGERRRVEAIPC